MDLQNMWVRSHGRGVHIQWVGKAMYRLTMLRATGEKTCGCSFVQMLDMLGLFRLVFVVALTTHFRSNLCVNKHIGPLLSAVKKARPLSHPSNPGGDIPSIPEC